MADLSNYAEQKLLDHLHGVAAFTMPTSLYIQLHTGDPGEDGTANVATESDRVLVTANAAATPAGTTSLPVADADWLSVAGTETFTHYTVWDAATGGNCLVCRGDLVPDVGMVIGENFKIPADALTHTLA